MACDHNAPRQSAHGEPADIINAEKSASVARSCWSAQRLKAAFAGLSADMRARSAEKLRYHRAATLVADGADLGIKLAPTRKGLGGAYAPPKSRRCPAPAPPILAA